jgi:flavin reductase (DIM6/NTAB) family NADH-FMN oxidoreductase RutF
MEVFLDQEQIAGLEKLERAAMVNSITGFKNANLIGTLNGEGNSNLAIFNSVVHIGANPAFMGFIIRPDSVERHTLKNIEELRCFTINHVNEKMYKQAHQTSARYPAEISEFDACGLNPVFKNEFPAPYVMESNITIGLSFQERIDIKLNGTILVIGKVVQLYFPENAWCLDGFVDIEKAGTIACCGLDSYHQTKRIARLSYAKPDKDPVELEMKYK